MATMKKDEPVKEIDKKEQVLLTEAEFERKQRLKNREKINRVTRVFGLIAILILVYQGIYDPLFELSFFGFIFDKSAFVEGWKWANSLAIYDDLMEFGNWLPQLGITAGLVGVTVLLVYFLTYTIVDIVEMIRSLIESGRDITRDLSGNVKDTMNIEIPKKEEKKKPGRKSLFVGDDVRDGEVPQKERKERKPRRTESDTKDLNNLSPDQLDALLSGKPIEEVLGNIEENNIDLPPIDL